MLQTATHQRTPSARRDLPLDGEGFLVDPKLWSRGMARFIARLDGVWPLTPEHWSVIYYMREHRMTYGALPPVSQVCRTHGLDRHAVQRLFGSCRDAWRIAGLPHPGEEALNYMV